MREITKELYSTTLSNDEFENLCTQVFSKKFVVIRLLYYK